MNLTWSASATHLAIYILPPIMANVLHSSTREGCEDDGGDDILLDFLPPIHTNTLSSYVFLLIMLTPNSHQDNKFPSDPNNCIKSLTQPNKIHIPHPAVHPLTWSTHSAFHQKKSN